MGTARCIDFLQMRSRKQISTIRPSRLPFGQDSRHWAAAVGQGRSPGGLPWPATPPNSNDDRGPEKVYTVWTQPGCGRVEWKKRSKKAPRFPWSYDHEGSGGDGLISMLDTDSAAMITAEDFQVDLIMRDVKLASREGNTIID